jgi:hypothetical protein
MISLKDSIRLFSKMKDNHPELEIYVENGHFVITENIIRMGVIENGK